MTKLPTTLITAPSAQSHAAQRTRAGTDCHAVGTQQERQTPAVTPPATASV